MDTVNSPYDKDPETFLREKIEYHREQAKLHKKLMEDSKEKLARLGGAASGGVTANVEDTHNVIVHPDSDFRLSIWRLKVSDVLLKATTPLTSEEILSLIDPGYINDKNLRRKAIGSISNSLQSLIRDGKVSKHGNVGRGNKYSFKQEAPAISGAS